LNCFFWTVYWHLLGYISSAGRIWNQPKLIRTSLHFWIAYQSANGLFWTCPQPLPLILSTLYTHLFIWVKHIVVNDAEGVKFQLPQSRLWYWYSDLVQHRRCWITMIMGNLKIPEAYHFQPTPGLVDQLMIRPRT
jgi:hypothetical protein